MDTQMNTNNVQIAVCRICIERIERPSAYHSLEVTSSSLYPVLWECGQDYVDPAILSCKHYSNLGLFTQKPSVHSQQFVGCLVRIWSGRHWSCPGSPCSSLWTHPLACTADSCLQGFCPACGLGNTYTVITPKATPTSKMPILRKLQL